MTDRTEITELLERASRLTGTTSLSIECRHENLETVYVDVRDGAVVVADRGETWAWITSRPEEQKPWDDSFVSALTAEHGISVEIGHWSEVDDEVISQELVLVLRDDERMSVAVDRFADVLDAIFDWHDTGGGWRSDE